MPEIEHLEGKIGAGDFESLRAVLNQNADVFSKHKADIGCCNFVEHEIELEEGAVPHSEGARQITSHKAEACLAEKKFSRIRHDRTLEITVGLRGSHGKKEKGQLRFCCDFRYLNAVK